MFRKTAKNSKVTSPPKYSAEVKLLEAVLRVVVTF
jgi:hypothetical protein